MKAHKLTAITAVIIILITNTAAAFSDGKTTFSVKYKDEIIRYKTFGIYVMPGEKVDFEVLDTPDQGNYGLEAGADGITKVDNNKWRWEVPQEKGLYELVITNPPRNDTMILNTFVMVPFRQIQGEYLNGYRIGKYPEEPLRDLEIYEPPDGFIEVTEQNQDTYISPHFQLKQFLCKQNGDYPEYVVLRERLLSKLEIVLAKVNEADYQCETFYVMSGYRTPYYNEVIRDVRYSRHIYGGAADIFIDVDPVDGVMDDLNKDGKINYSDADVLYDIVDDMYGKPWYEILIGGLGKYGCTECHGPFVHIDVRGFRARW
ncbi:MAG: hypothetical protein OEV79_11355 [candidate division WOR-3 bacterium]|nr:hypothetical protein [candidate division WOR-3 bacterium]